MNATCRHFVPPPDALVARRQLLPLLRTVAARVPASPALLAPAREPLCYADLVAQVERVGDRLRSLGFGHGDRIATALPDSPAAALMMVSVIAHCAAVPVNPRSTPAEVERLLTGVKARAIVVPAGTNSPARRAAERLELLVLELRPAAAGPAGRFDLEPQNLVPSSRDTLTLEDDSEPADVERDKERPADAAALVIHTSGTTGFPKVVPLTQDNLLSMMLANCEVLGLTQLDRYLGVMPLCHIHGLGAILCSLLSGGSAVVMPGFEPDAFFDALARYSPTWYTAVPAIHQSILGRACDHEAVVRAVAEGKTLRFVRSGSAPMPRGVPERLETLFNTVYVEASGATEASAYICSNRPGRGRIGSVGLPMPGTDVRVIDPTGKPLGPNAEGELVARGPGIFAGYEGNPAATAAAFVDGFFRTGDLARCDDDGFFYITGRIKEQINRGGTKISPHEVEDALLGHPDVVQAVAFGEPDALLGEDVAAAVVLRPGAAALTELDLQRHVAPTLADHKVPRRVVFIDEVPVGPGGKVARLKLAEQLGLAAIAAPSTTHPTSAPYNEPVTPTEQALAAIWSDVLGRRVGDVDAPFESLGVDSIQALKIALAIEQRFGRVMPLAALSTRRSIRAAAGLLESDGWRPEPGAPVVLREGRPGRPVLFVLPGIGGNVYSYYALAQHLPERQRVVGLPLPGADGLEAPLDSVPAVADRLTAAILREQPQGPYLLCGDSFGGRAAFEVARRLVAAGAEVKLLAMFDTPAPGWPPPLKLPDRVATHWSRILTEGPGQLLRRAANRVLGDTPQAAAVVGDELNSLRLAGERGAAALQNTIAAAYQSASDRWRPEPLNVRLSLLRAEVPTGTNCDSSDPAMGWSGLAAGGVDVTIVPGRHGTLFHGYNVTHAVDRIAALIV